MVLWFWFFITGTSNSLISDIFLKTWTYKYLPYVDQNVENVESSKTMTFQNVVFGLSSVGAIFSFLIEDVAFVATDGRGKL
jgi:hypothetical protein